MKIAVLGGGVAGLATAYFLTGKGHRVTVFEKENFLGGLAGGFKKEGWDWYLDKTYHHLFANDKDFLEFNKIIGFDGIFFNEPETASLYQSSKFKVQSSKFSIHPLDTAFDFLEFPLLNPLEKARAGAVIAFLKLSPFLSYYEKMTSEEFLKKTMGNEVWKILWRELFRKKFGKFAGNILASFFWARIKKRTKKLGYIKGGFQTWIDFLADKNERLGVVIRKNYEVQNVKRQRSKFRIGEEIFDAVVSTLPTPILVKVGQTIFPQDYLKRLKKIDYLHSVNLIIESDRPFLEKAYWLNVCDAKIPIMGLMQQTNFIDKKHYNNKHILYIANYVNEEDKIWKMEDREVFNYFLPYLKQINKTLHVTRYTLHAFKYAQPIFDKNFVQNKPDFFTPVKNFFIANLDMTYPYDRGVNYAVVLARKVSSMI